MKAKKSTTKQIKINFGKLFREKRDEHKISRAKLADRMQVSPKTIQSWEMGRTFPEDLSLFPKIEDILEVNVTDMIRKAIA